MARAKISEYRAKKIIYKALGNDYQGLSVNTANINEHEIVAFVEAQEKVVVKVDQAVKKRNKLGLVFIGVTSENIIATTTKLKDLGYG